VFTTGHANQDYIKSVEFYRFAENTTARRITPLLRDVSEDFAPDDAESALPELRQKWYQDVFPGL